MQAFDTTATEWVSYSRDGQKHDHQGLLAEDRMLDQLISETNKASSSLLKKDSGIGCKMSPIHCKLHESKGMEVGGITHIALVWGATKAIV